MSSAENENLCVNLIQGKLRGTVKQTKSGISYYSFKGIPYAKAPVGNLRFTAPQPYKKWDGILDASEHRSVCPQWDKLKGAFVEGSEDCLFLNVYVPFDRDCKYPVMVWFHGGGFISGSGNSFLYGPDYLIEENVILVTVNYRLEVLGFLNLDTEEVPGNAGMKDQVMALNWVKENISKFGGDSNNVTIFGQSAGGACCTYHLVSPMSRGLFHKVIAQSGCCFNEWARTSYTVDRAFKLGRHLGIDTNDKSELLSHLRRVPVEKLVYITKKIWTTDEEFRNEQIGFSVSKEKCFKGQESYLPIDPEECLLKGNFEKVPILIGYNNLEGLIIVNGPFKRLNEDKYVFAQYLLKYILTNASKGVVTSIAEQVKRYYFGDRNVGEDTVSQIVQLETDVNFNYSIQKFVREMAKVSPSPVFFYKFSVDANWKNAKTNTKVKSLIGAGHGDDLHYLFKTLMKIENENDHYKIVKRMTRMWTNFAKYGDPTPKDDPILGVRWKPVTATETNFLNIDLELKPGVNPDKEMYDFWSSILKQVDNDKRALECHL